MEDNIHAYEIDFMIPNEFTVGCTKLKVEIVDRIANTEVLGNMCLAEGKITIAKSADGVPQCDSSMTNTFFHELTHAVLDSIGEKELSSNERFVCAFSSTLAQAITTMKFNQNQ